MTIRIKMMDGEPTTIYVYGYIGDSPWDEVAAEDFVKEVAGLNGEDLTVRIHSPGGSVFAGVAIYSALRRYAADTGANVTTQVDGMAASMASIIALAGTERKITQAGRFMVHNPSGGVYGGSDEMRKYADLLDGIKTQMLKIYADNSTLTESDISELMDNETFMNSQDAMDWGFFDEITEQTGSVQEAKLTKQQMQYIPEFVAKSFMQPAEMKADNQRVDDMSDKTERPAETEKVDAGAVAEAAIKTERKRTADIRALFSKHDDYQDICNAAINDGKSPNEAARMLVDALGKDSKPVSGQIEVSADKKVDGLKAALEMRGGIKKRDHGDGLSDFANMSVMDVARECAVMAGNSVSGARPLDIARMATHSTSDFPNILANTCDKAVLQGWDEREDTSYLQFTSQGTVSDFKVSTRAGLLSFSDLDLVPEGDEYEYGTMGENGANVQVAKYGKKISFTWEAMINDDLGEFLKTAVKMGAAARRKESMLVYSVLSGNPKLADGKTLFHAGHGNIAATPGAPSEALLEEIITAMETQTRNGVDLAVDAGFYVGPKKYQFSVNRLLQSAARPGTSNDEINVLQGIVTPVHTNRLSGDAWYILGSGGDTIEVTHLAGYETPEVMQADGVDVDGIEYKVRHIVAANPLDYVGIFKNAGA